MERPKKVTVIINWIDENGKEHECQYNESDLEAAETLIGLMTGNICEADLES